MEDEINQQFDDMGIEPEPDILHRCVDLAITYNMDDAAEFVESWMAFSLSHLNGQDPTIDNLSEFERKVLQVKRDKSNTITHQQKKRVSAVSNISAAALEHNPLAMYGIETHEVNDEMMDEYINESTTIETKDSAAAATNVNTPKAKGTLPMTPVRKGFAAAQLFSPASYSPLSVIGRTPSTMTPGRSGDTVYTFGNPKLLAKAQWDTKLSHPLPVKQLLRHNGEALNPNKVLYMFDQMQERADLSMERLMNVGEKLVQCAYGDAASEFDWYQEEKGTLDNFKMVGSIHSEFDGPLDAHSCVLAVPTQGSCEFFNLNFSKVNSVGIFPGQIVIASGTNPQRNIFIVEEILTERVLKPPPSLCLERELIFVVAAGPYSYNDDLIYDPLHDLLKYLQDNKPDILILVGPFLEASHNIVSENATIAETFDSFFEKMIASIVEKIGTTTTILMVMSHKDAHAQPVYPTPPVTLRKTYPNVHILADPSIVDLDGITVGITSTDIVDHLVGMELASNAGDKVKRVVNYLLHQGSFYPLNPPADEELCLDTELTQKFATIEEVPNILILPSKQKCFVRMVNGCLAINPGRLTDEKTNGTFARFIVTPTMPTMESSSSNNSTTAGDTINLYNCVGCQIRRV